MAEPPFGHEPSGIAVRRILQIGVVICVGVILTVLIVYEALQHRHESARARLAAGPAVLPPPPRLQAHPGSELAALRAQKQAVLGSWGWTDRSAGYAHIPIERAMALYLQEQQRLHTQSTGAAPGSPR